MTLERTGTAKSAGTTTRGNAGATNFPRFHAEGVVVPVKIFCDGVPAQTKAPGGRAVSNDRWR